MYSILKNFLDLRGLGNEHVVNIVFSTLSGPIFWQKKVANPMQSKVRIADNLDS